MHKLLGYILIILALVIIFIILYQSYRIFNGEAQAPQIFTIAATQSVQTNSLLPDIQKQIEQQVAKVLPVESATKILNLIVWSIFAGIMFLGAGQIAGIGVKLISIKTEQPQL